MWEQWNNGIVESGAREPASPQYSNVPAFQYSCFLWEFC
jgi:hypothetical protein